MPDILPIVQNQVLDANGDPAPGAKVYVYQLNTTDLVTIYTDPEYSIEAANPIVADAGGFVDVPYYNGAEAVTLVFETAAGETITTNQSVAKVSTTLNAAGSIAFTPSGNNPATNVQDAIDNASDAVASTPTVTNLDTLAASGFSGFASTATGAPDTGGAYSNALLQTIRSGTRKSQLAFVDEDNVFQRVDTGSGYSDWEKILSTAGNENLTAQRLRVTATSDLELSSVNHGFQIGDDSGPNLAMDNDEFQARDNGAASALNIQREGGDLNLGSASSGTITSEAVHVFAKGTAAEPGISIADTGFFMDGIGGTLRVALAGNEHAVFQGSSFNTSVHTVQTREKADARFVRQSAGQVGSPAYMLQVGGGTVTYGGTITTSGSIDLIPSDADGTAYFGQARPNGETWRCMGGSNNGRVSQWVRVS